MKRYCCSRFQRGFYLCVTLLAFTPGLIFEYRRRELFIEKTSEPFYTLQPLGRSKASKLSNVQAQPARNYTTKRGKSTLTEDPITISDMLSETDRLYFEERDEIEARVLDRKVHLEENKSTVCGGKAKLASLLYTFNEINLAWCPVFKSGSTLWKLYFINRFVPDAKSTSLDTLENFIVPQSYRKNLNQKFNELHPQFGQESAKRFNGISQKLNEQFTRFTVVRHPLSRLISHVHNARKDGEMVAMRKQWIYPAMLMNRRSRVPKGKLKQYTAELAGFFDWLKDRSTAKGVYRISEGNALLDPPYPVLIDLINYLIKTKKNNGHWQPATSFCGLCAVQYDFILKLEESPLETWFALEKLGLWEDRGSFLGKPNSSGKGGSEAGIFEQELEKLNNQQRNWVNSWFRDDFELLGYEKLKIID